ncbi:sclerostin [Takifugu rubripes]|uniref:sclerostin n=1 Tax=Takifugu rubripes TaxID=31033 RepID=UPI000298C6DE|nr:sclerostin [Takifugu rubripes]|eukprot:XP_003961087.1 PREDICTED: sclerostin [Takifugu rubripes]
MQVSLVLLVSSSALVLLQGCCTAARGWKVLKNDATEILPDYRERSPHEPMTQAANSSSNGGNRAKSGGRSTSSVTYSASELSCRELRSTRYVTDGSCRSAKPIKELVCSGQCLPAHLMPNTIGRGKWWRSNTSEYRCIPAHSRTRRIQLQCPNGNTRTYKIRIVTSCKCKRFRAHHNQSEAKEVLRRQRSKKRTSQGRSKNNTPLIDNSY